MFLIIILDNRLSTFYRRNQQGCFASFHFSNKHRSRIHGAIQNMVKCAICKKRFDSVPSLESHHRSAHKGQKFALLRDNSSRNRVLVAVIIVLFVGGIGGYFLIQSTLNASSNPLSTTAVSSWIGREAPSFVLPGVDSQNSVFNLSDYRGKSNVLILFNEGLSCQPCLQQMVDMNTNYSAFRALNIVPVAITADSASSMAQWAKVNGVNQLIVLSDQNLNVDKLYGTLGSSISMMGSSAPGHTFFLINKSGTIIWRADYGPGTMYVPENQIFSNINRVLSSSSS